MSQHILLQATHVAKQYPAVDGMEGPQVLRDVSLELADGQTLAIVGPSGCGKSTLLNILGALDQPTDGSVTLEGRNLRQADATQLAAIRSRRIGFVFQQHHLLPQCTVMENVLLPALALARRVPQDTIDRAGRLLDMVGLSSHVRHRPGELSGGQCQRVAVVRALINQPALLLADEPTGSLDPAGAQALALLLAELNRRQSLAMIVVTHWMELASRMQRVLHLRDGRLAVSDH